MHKDHCFIIFREEWMIQKNLQKVFNIQVLYVLYIYSTQYLFLSTCIASLDLLELTHGHQGFYFYFCCWASVKAYFVSFPEVSWGILIWASFILYFSLTDIIIRWYPEKNTYDVSQCCTPILYIYLYCSTYPVQYSGGRDTGILMEIIQREELLTNFEGRDMNLKQNTLTLQ